MDAQNSSESVSSDISSSDDFRKVFNIPNEVCSNKNDGIRSSVLVNCCDEKSNYSSSLYDQETTFHHEDSKQSILLEILKIQERKTLALHSNNESDREDIQHDTKNFIPTIKESISSPQNKIKIEPPDNFRLSNDADSKENLLTNSIKQEESNDLPAIESGEDTSNQDTRRTRRFKRRRDEECCPVCGITLRVPELQNHYNKEIENLSKIPNRNVRKSRSEEKGINMTYVQVKGNRENRLSAKVARYAARAKNEVQCPVCSLRMTGSQEEINKHVANCINEDENSDELVVVDDEDSFEEYEFADQTRVRAISLVPGGYRSLLGSSTNKATEDNEDLNVDVDDTMTYGKPQYTELDVIHNSNDVTEVEELNQLRKAVLLDPTVQPNVLESRKWCKTIEETKTSEEPSNSLTEEKLLDSKDENKEMIKKDEESSENVLSNPVISSLREKIKDLEEQARNVKCLICLEPYTKPVVSTTCWHVYCEECWLMTMGVKKLCPQCNMIVFPSDLRRIFL